VSVLCSDYSTEQNAGPLARAASGHGRLQRARKRTYRTAIRTPQVARTSVSDRENADRSLIVQCVEEAESRKGRAICFEPTIRLARLSARRLISICDFALSSDVGGGLTT